MRKTLVFWTIAVLLAGCNLPAPGVPPLATPTTVPAVAQPSPSTPTELPPLDTPAVTATQPAQPTAPPGQETAPPQRTSPPTTEPSAPTATTAPPTATTGPQQPELPEEAILIMEPGPGSRLTSPVRVAGIANSTFEQTLGVSIVLDDGTQIALGPAMIDAELGQRGQFEVDVPFEILGERQAFIQVFDASARDGGIIHLASVGVTLAESGEQNIVRIEPYPERIVIYQPQLTAQVSGGVAHVEGFALASFEQTLLVEVQDADGNVVGSQSTIVNAPDLGQPGPFAVDVPYRTNSSGPGRIAVRDVSPAFGGDNHVASVEINLAP